MSATLLYDADCGFCTLSASWASRLGCDVEPVPWQAYPALAARGISPEAANAELHLVDGDTLYRGHEAVGQTLKSSRHLMVRLAGMATNAPAMRPLAARTYAWVAAHRSSLPGGTDSCRLGS